MTATALATPTRKTTLPSDPPEEIFYPDSDGQPMADNTRQFDYIVMIQGGLAAMFADRSDVFVAGDLLWYPVEGDNKTRAAPDAMVVFGRPPGYRGSYIQHREDGIAPQVVFEVLSPSTADFDRGTKFHHYRQIGSLQAYVLIDPVEQAVELRTKRADGAWELRDVEGTLVLACVGIELPLAELFDLAGVR